MSRTETILSILQPGKKLSFAEIYGTMLKASAITGIPVEYSRELIIIRLNKMVKEKKLRYFRNRTKNGLHIYERVL